MEFRYFDPKKKIVSREVKVGMEWKDVKTSNKLMNSIFARVDNGDGIVSETELDSINRIFKEKDINNNGISENSELEVVAEFSKDTWNYIKSKIQVAENLYNDIYAKTSLGLPTTGKNIDKHVKMVNKDNVWTVLKVYQDKTNGEESLFSGIMGEIGLSYEKRASYCKQIMNQLISLYKDQGLYTDDIVKEFNAELKYQGETWSRANAKRLDAIVNKLMLRYNAVEKKENYLPNGKIDKDFSQGNTGDCWLLASIKAISRSPRGLKILNDSIKVAPNGNVTVTLKGAGKSYTFTRAEILGNKQFSSGDLDVRAIEMAVDRYFTDEKESKNVGGEIDINSNVEDIAYQILTGKGACDHFFFRGSKFDELFLHENRYEIRQEHIDRFNDKNHIICVSANHNKKDVKVSTTKENEGVLTTDHSYAVSRADKNYVYLINPWDTSSELKVDMKTFKSFFNIIYEMDL